LCGISTIGAATFALMDTFLSGWISPGEATISTRSPRAAASTCTRGASCACPALRIHRAPTKISAPSAATTVIVIPMTSFTASALAAHLDRCA
jgi:hypothetical protein